MFRFRGRKFHLRQRHEHLLQNIFRLAVTEAERAAIQNQLRRLRVVERLAPVLLTVFFHRFNS